MTDPKSPDADKQSILFSREWFARNRWTVVGIAAAILILLIIALVAGGTGAKPAKTVSTGPAPANAVKTSAASSQLPAILTTAAPEPEKKPVDFTLNPGNTVNCGLTCRQLSASITNTGYETAHNVCISLHMTNSKGDVIGLNGADPYQKCIGTLDAGQTKTEPVTINADCGTFALKCIKETLTLQTWVSSDETTVRFPETILAV